MSNTIKKALFISASPGGLNASQEYLSSRGWSITVTDDLRLAMNTLMIHQPEIVVVCIDHPNKNVANLPKMILERVRCCVIVTSEVSNLENYHLLNKSNCEFKVFPPVSGPAIERTVFKYTKKMETVVMPKKDLDPKRSGISPRLFKLNQGETGPSSIIDYANLETKKRFDLTPEERRGFLPENNKILVRGTEKIISEILENKTENGEPIESPKILLGRTSKITCLAIECGGFQGYLVAAMGEECQIDDTFMGLVHRHLIQFLDQNGERVSDSDVFNMNIKPVAFLDWAREYADFLRKSIHKGNEIAFAFFPLKGVRASYKSSASQDMLSVPIHELFGNTKLGFDLFLFLPTNAKYVLYTPSGAVFYEHQQKRLMSRGIEFLHIKRDQLKELNKYRAQRYFNTILDEYVTGAP